MYMYIYYNLNISVSLFLFFIQIVLSWLKYFVFPLSVGAIFKQQFQLIHCRIVLFLLTDGYLSFGKMEKTPCDPL